MPSFQIYIIKKHSLYFKNILILNKSKVSWDDLLFSQQKSAYLE